VRNEGRDVQTTGGARAHRGGLVLRLARAEEAAMADASVARMRCNSRSRGILSRSLRETRSKGRDVKTTGGARARRGVLISGGCTQVQTFGGRHVAGEEIAHGAQRSCQSGGKAAVMANYGSGVYSDRSGWCWDGMECGSQRGGGSAKQPMPKGDAATSSMITRLLGFHAADRHGAGRFATADGMGHSDGRVRTGR
jgi:hypothetical protein